MIRFHPLMLVALAAVVFAPAAKATAEENDMPAARRLVDFATGGGEWFVVNDGVMGGLSRSAIRATDDGTGLFTGDISLQNNGGFASVRTVVGPTDLSGHAGLELKVRGDGRTYQLRLREDGRLDGVAYRTFFETTGGEWITVHLPFAEFRPTIRGRTLENVRALDPARVTQLSFLLADKQPGAFSLEIKFVQVWRKD